MSQWAVVGVLVAGMAGAADLASLDVLNAGYPRAFYFRQTEGTASSGEMTYEEWSKRYDGLDGIMGKVLEEEVPGRSKGQPFFQRFKADHPAQAVLLHLNGDGRDPHDQGTRFFAGHWLYHNGATVTADVPATTGETVIAVSDPELFQVNVGRFGTTNDDIGLCRLGTDGKPDWSHAEQVALVAVDHQAKTITVRRGAYGTKPLAFEGGRAYAAVHVANGPWGGESHWIWFYNHATTCPKDAQGRTCSDVVLEIMAEWFAPGGPLENFDGLEFDVARWEAGGGAGKRRPDANADGIGDSGHVDGVNVYGLGMLRFHQQVRTLMGDDRLIMADYNGAGNQRSFGILNGIESEGWPHLADHAVARWSEALNRHLYWREHGRAPVFNYINHKFMSDGHRSYDAPLSLSRLVLGVAVMTDSAVTYALQPKGGANSGAPIWDELCMGTAQRLHWLGMPEGETIRLAQRTPDLLGAAQVGWESDDARIEATADGRGVRIAPNAGETEARVRLVDLEVPGGDLSMFFQVRAEPMAAYPESVARLLYVSYASNGTLVRSELPAAGMRTRTGAASDIERGSGASVSYLAQHEIAGETHAAYRVHPPYQQPFGPGAVHWERSVRVPAENSTLRFETGLSPARGKSDGLVYSVQVIEGEKETEVFKYAHRSFAWEAHTVDLSAWAGHRVTLRFVADAGPDDDTVADHGAWGDVVLGAVPGTGAGNRSGQSFTLAGAEPFDASFYFRDVRPGPIELTFRLEGEEPVEIAGLSIHAATDALARRFEHGVVLVNPADHPYTFDLAALFPGVQLRRIQGSPAQDPETNNGAPVEGTVTLGAKDGLFLTVQE